MKVFEIIDYCGNNVGYVNANNEKQALCMYLMNHEELIDVMLWRAPSGLWKLAKYNEEDFFMYARCIYDV